MKHIRKCTLLLICLLTAAAKKLQPVKVTDTAFTRLSRTELQISW